MIPFKPPARKLDPQQTLKLADITSDLLNQYLPVYRRRDPQGAQFEASKRFKQALRKQIRKNFPVKDMRSIQVELFVTLVGGGYGWRVEVVFDRMTDNYEAAMNFKVAHS